MAIEIKELFINIKVAESSSGGNQSGVKKKSDASVVEECLDQMMYLLKQKNER